MSEYSNKVVIQYIIQHIKVFSLQKEKKKVPSVENKVTLQSAVKHKMRARSDLNRRNSLSFCCFPNQSY